jgi:molybdopterin molybdotransferase
MTGAGIPREGDTVVAIENTTIQDNHLVVSAPVSKGQNIRFGGEEIKRNERVLPQGSVVNPGTIGFLATMGMKKITVYKKPRIALIATGSELVSPGVPLSPGKIYDSNTFMILAALEDMRIRPVFVRRLSDKPTAMRTVIDFALGASDIVILMGGVSAGDHDHVKDILGQAGVKTRFWKVSQKPGKPLYFGTKKNCMIFGLPGNPAAVFTCFYEYVYPAIRRSMGHRNPYLSSEKLQLKEPLRPDPEKYLFIKSRIEHGADKTVFPLPRQKSHMISSLCDADSLVMVPNSDRMIKKGENVFVHFLPYALQSTYDPTTSFDFGARKEVVG